MVVHGARLAWLNSKAPQGKAMPVGAITYLVVDKASEANPTSGIFSSLPTSIGSTPFNLLTISLPLF
jgi:hypothetical protein